MWACKGQTESRKTVAHGICPNWWIEREQKGCNGLFYLVVALGNIQFMCILICKPKGMIKTCRWP